MNKALFFGALATIALTGCSPVVVTPDATPASQAMTAAEPTSIYQAVWQNWDGDRPEESWIDSAALLVCKQIIGDIEPRVVMDHAANNAVVVAAAEQFICEIDR